MCWASFCRTVFLRWADLVDCLVDPLQHCEVHAVAIPSQVLCRHEVRHCSESPAARSVKGRATKAQSKAVLQTSWDNDWALMDVWNETQTLLLLRWGTSCSRPSAAPGAPNRDPTGLCFAHASSSAGFTLRSSPCCHHALPASTFETCSRQWGRCRGWERCVGTVVGFSSQTTPQRGLMYVVKRDGRQEPVHFDKITARISRLAYGLNPDFCDPVGLRGSASRDSILQMHC